MTPGRSCPLAYRYSPRVFDREPDFAADTLYVVGGLYGNFPALEAIERLAESEPDPPAIMFNGDFHWFDIDAAGFSAVQHGVLRHRALRGNVETEIAGEDGGAGCGCAYPDSVDAAEVERSNEILRRLRGTAAGLPAQRAALGALPMHAVAQVGPARVGIVHGDAESLAGWAFAHDALDTPARAPALGALFAAANVDLFASSHTCLPALRDFELGGRHRVIANNGAAGMPNFRSALHGLITRIGVRPFRGGALYGTRAGGVHTEALAVHYDIARFRSDFLANWPAGSPGHESYFPRISGGPEFVQASARAAAR